MQVGRALVALLAGLALATGTTASAVADDTANARPVTAPDRVSGLEGDIMEVEPLANDSDPDGDKLAICRLGLLPSGVTADFYDDTVMIEADRSGTFSLDYYACDYDYLVRGTITVVATARPAVHLQVRKLPRAGRIRVANHGDFRLSFAWGSARAKKADGSRWIAPGKAVVVSVQRHSIVWVAANESRHAFAIGHVRHIRLPKGTEPLPANTYAGEDRGDASSRPSSAVARPWWGAAA